jgi:uncharacterized protein YgiM (DUF1202 family)
MRKFRVTFLTVILLCFIPICAALARSGTVTASSLNIRKSASADSDVVGVLREGTRVTIKDTSGSWYKITSGSKSGYVYKKYIELGDSGSSSSSSSKSSSSSSSSGGTCGPGDHGDAVKKVQKKLKNLGYYSGGIDGDYGNGTKTAVKDFQRRNGLSVTGSVNSKTLSKLNSSSAKKASSSSSGGDSGGTERLNWFNGGSSKIPKGATFKVKDIKTGKTFTCKRWSGANHLDAEPKTKSDAKVMKSIYGHWSWKRRAILVRYNGHVYAASMNGMPHGTSTISSNNFDGHFCIHFYKSKTHGTHKVDNMHQNCVATAMKHSW